MTDIPEDVMKMARHAASHVRNNDDAAAVENIVARALIADRAAQAERMARMEEALRSLTVVTRFELEDNANRAPWKRLLANADAALSARALSQEGSEPS